MLLRELLALSLCHSKSAIPNSLLSDTPALRRIVCTAIFTSLQAQYEARRSGSWSDAVPEEPSELARHYSDPDVDPFAWLESSSVQARELRADVVDTLRVLRVADALRQRGTDLRTSAGFEVFLDNSGSAVFAMATRDGRFATHLRIDSPMSVGEANIDTCSLTPAGDLLIEFHRGLFPPAAAMRVAEACALVTMDIAADVLDVFPRAPSAHIVLVSPEDEPMFSRSVRECMLSESPALGQRTRVEPNVRSLDDEERQRYERATPVNWPSALAEHLLEELASRGLATHKLDPALCFTDVRIAEVDIGEILMHEEAEPTFVYVPTNEGVHLDSGAGFASKPLPAWIQIGATGVVRQGVRNSTVRVVRRTRVIMIPGAIFARQWFRPYGIDEIDQLVQALELGEDEPICS
jgi:hypothetical protein